MFGEIKNDSGDFWRNEQEKIAFGLYCSELENCSAIIDISEQSERLSMSEEMLRQAFVDLAKRGVLRVCEDVMCAGIFSVEEFCPKVFVREYGTHEYYSAIEAIALKIYEVDGQEGIHS